MSDRKPLKSLKRRILYKHFEKSRQETFPLCKNMAMQVFASKWKYCPSDGKDAEENVRTKKSLLPVLLITLHIFIFFMDAISWSCNIHKTRAFRHKYSQFESPKKYCTFVKRNQWHRGENTFFSKHTGIAKERNTQISHKKRLGVSFFTSRGHHEC